MLHIVATSRNAQHVNTQSTARIQAARFSSLFCPEFKEKKEIKYTTLVQIILNTLLQKIASSVLCDPIQITN